MSRSLVRASKEDIDELMSWFPDAASADLWSGPIFRFPFTRETFYEDCRWQDFASYRLLNSADEFAAFGQIGERYGRSHLARLVVKPELRGQGMGSILMSSLIAEARRLFDYRECGLFVFRHNLPALKCYQAAGFEITDYPDDAPMPDACYYLIRGI